MVLSPAVVSGAQFRRQRQKPSKELYNAGRRVVETFQGLGGVAIGMRCVGASFREAPFIES